MDGCLLQVGVGGDVGQEVHFHRGIVHVATVVLQAVADDEVVGAQRAVVRIDLLENGLRDGDVGGLVFYDDARKAAGTMVEYAVATTLYAANVDGYFVGQQAGRVLFFMHEEVDEVLPDPLLGREPHIAATQEIVDGCMTVLLT